MTNTSPMYRYKMSWISTREILDRVCDDLDLELFFCPVSKKYVFKRKRVDDTLLYDLEMCFGDQGNIQFVASIAVLMRMSEGEIRKMLETWLRGRHTI